MFLDCFDGVIGFFFWFLFDWVIGFFFCRCASGSVSILKAELLVLPYLTWMALLLLVQHLDATAGCMCISLAVHHLHSPISKRK